MGLKEPYNKNSIERVRLIFAEVYEMVQTLDFDYTEEYVEIIKNNAYESMIDAEVHVVKALSLFKNYIQVEEEREAWEKKNKTI